MKTTTGPEELERRRLIKRIDSAIQHGLVTRDELDKLPPSEWEEYLQGLQAIRDRLGMPGPVE